MSKKTKASGIWWKILLLVLAVLVLSALIIGAVTLAQPDASIDLTPVIKPTDPPTQPTEPPYLPIDLGNDLILRNIGPYTGPYVEDGTNELVTDVLMLVLENRSTQALQYATLTMELGGQTANFALTNLPAGQMVVLLETGRMAYVEAQPQNIQVNTPLFVEEFPMYPQIFAITGGDGTVTVTNISQEPVSGDIYVYYKNSSQDLFYGGITFRAKITGGLQPGESKETVALHHYPDASTILMVTYTP